MSESKRNPSVSQIEFLKVVATPEGREEYPTQEEAAAALGMNVGSFRTRLSNEKKAAPALFDGLPNYRRKAGQGSRMSAAELIEALRPDLVDNEDETSEDE